MNFEFMTIDTPLPPCMPFPRALTGFPVSSTAKVMYCRMLDAMLSNGQEDENGILFVCFPVTAIAAVLSRSSMTVKRSLNDPMRQKTRKKHRKGKRIVLSLLVLILTISAVRFAVNQTAFQDFLHFNTDVASMEHMVLFCDTRRIKQKLLRQIMNLGITDMLGKKRLRRFMKVVFAWKNISV